MGKKILVINGPNLEMLGKRDKSTYGDFSLESLEKLITEEANTLGCQVEFFQNNIEGEIINKLNRLDDSCLLYTSPSPRDRQKSRMPSSA